MKNAHVNAPLETRSCLNPFYLGLWDMLSFSFWVSHKTDRFKNIFTTVKYDATTILIMTLLIKDNTYNDFTYNDFTYNDFTYNDTL